MTEPDRQVDGVTQAPSKDQKWPTWFRFYHLSAVIVTGALALLSLLGGAYVLDRMLPSTYIGSVTSESAALTRANERLLEMVKWTISTLLLIGGGLIGLNWYSNEHRYHADKTKFDQELKDQRRSYDLRLSLLEAKQSVDEQAIFDSRMDIFRLTSQITQSMLLSDEVASSGGYVSSVIRLLGRADAGEIVRQNALEGVIVMFQRPDAARSFDAYLGAEKLPELVESAKRREHRKEAERIEELYKTYLASKEDES